MRKLATIQRIAEVKTIENADKIVAYRIGGWWVVDSKDKYQVGDFVVYCEVDSWVPTEIAPFLSKGKEPKEFNGVKGERLRSVKLRGQVSQGLLLPMSVLPDSYDTHCSIEGDDATLLLNVQKWEAPIPACLAGDARGLFPSSVPKTDQPRLQNSLDLLVKFKDHSWEVTEKLDGTSCTFYLDKNEIFHVCSRNLSLKENETNAYWRVARHLSIESVMRENLMQGLAFQGEIIGEGIQGNQYGKCLEFYVYDIYDTNKNEYILPSKVQPICQKIGLNHVPIITSDFKFKDITADELLILAEGKSALNSSNREGIVLKSNSINDLSVKIISNSWLLKNE